MLGADTVSVQAVHVLTSSNYPCVLQAGEAIQLECECRGDLALRHNSCAVKWARVKGDNVCDICKQPIKNLPVITPRAPSEPGSEVDMTGFDDVDVHNHPHGFHGETHVALKTAKVSAVPVVSVRVTRYPTDIFVCCWSPCFNGWHMPLAGLCVLPRNLPGLHDMVF